MAQGNRGKLYAPGCPGSLQEEGMATGFKIITTVNGRENVSEETFQSFNEAMAVAKQRQLGSTKHLRAYRLEVVENFGDRSRYALHDKRWELGEALWGAP